MRFDVSNPDDRAVIIAARSFGVAPSIFMGRTTGPPWTADDRAAVMDLLVWESQLCPGCHQPLAETTLAENEFRYRARPAIRCHHCTASSIATDMHQNTRHASALLIPVELTE